MPDYIFPENFQWGAATASYQIEGATTADGRGETIWDRFCRTPGAVSGGDTGDIACEHYHRFREDIALMSELGLKSYRFSIAWSRLFPDGRGGLNQKGLDFYQHLVDGLTTAGIEPAATIYHWDLPQGLQDKGGWVNRDTAYYYTDYAVTLFEKLGDRVRRWITHNEPHVAAFLGHDLGIHAPGLKDNSKALQVAHHLLLSHAETVRVFREIGRPDSRIGITLNLYPCHPAEDTPEHEQAALIADGCQNRWWLDPVFKGSYPEDMEVIYEEKQTAPQIEPGDMDLFAKSRVDFLGVNYYSRQVVSPSTQGNWFRKNTVKDAPATEMGWEIYPEGLYELLTRLHQDYDAPEMYITENGAAFDDKLEDGKIHDSQRIDFLRRHFIQAHRAIQKGVKLKGYYVWTLMDNFEWSFGYSKRFGLMYLDYPTQARIPKDSALWYRDVTQENGVSEA